MIKNRSRRLASKGHSTRSRGGGSPSDPPTRIGSIASSGLALLLLASLTAGAAGYGLHTLREYASKRAQAELSLGRIATGINRQSTLEWQAIAEQGASAEIIDELDEERAHLAATVREFRELDPAFSESPLRSDFLRFQSVLAREIDLLRAGRFNAALRVDEAMVDPAYEELHHTIQKEAQRYQREGERADDLAEVGSIAVLVGSLAALMVLFWRFERLRRRAIEHEAVERNERRFRSLIENSSDLITVVDADGVIRDQSASVSQILGFESSELFGRKLMEIVHPDDHHLFQGLLPDEARSSAKPDKISTKVIEWRAKHRSGSWLPMETVCSDMLADPSVSGVVLNSRDVSERQQLEDQLRHLALHEPLTNLPNRALFLDRVEQALARLSRTKSRVGVLFVDLDDFKLINDSLGHDAGDRCLVEAAHRIKDCLRESDSCARIGGDEFAILVDDIEDDSVMDAIATRVIQALNRQIVLEGKAIHIQASVGIAIADGQGEGMRADSLMRSADAAMYTAKERGKNQHCQFESTMHDSALQRLEIGAELLGAVEAGELVLHYQPKIFLRSKKLAGFEALLRWQHPKKGLLAPAEFISMAEETGAIVPIGRWVLSEACHQAVQWHSDFDEPAAFTMAVNVSARQLDDPDFVKDVVAALDESRLAPEALVLEITESIAMRDVDTTLRRLAELKAVGVRIALDDFGTGYSSLSYLQRFPIDMLKVDRAFTAGLDKGPEESALARAIVQLGQSLELQVVAEGIENAEQLSELRTINCDLGQGFLLARPADAEQTAAWVEHALNRVPASGTTAG